jgi:hypothetical protein
MDAFGQLEKFPKTLLKYGSIVFFILFLIGTVMVLLTNTVLEFNTYLDLVSKSIVKVSFSIAAEVIIACLVIDYVVKK